MKLVSCILRILCLAVVLILPLSARAQDTAKESTFDRVMRTGVLRCGYYVFPPVTNRDPNTDALSGFTVDMMDEIGRRAGIKIEWAVETGFTDWVPSIQAGRFDVACTPNWPDIPLGRVVAFSTPMFYAGLYPMVRADDTRFQNDVEALNSADVIFSAPEGDAVISLVAARFPKAKIQTTPPGSDTATAGLEIITKKADATPLDHNGLYQFNKTNPGKLRLVGSEPIKLQPFNLAVERREMILKDWLDNAILDLINDGTMDRLLRKWEPEPGKTFLRVDNAYKTEN